MRHRSEQRGRKWPHSGALLGILIASLSAGPTAAQWNRDGALLAPTLSELSNQRFPQLVCDSGGRCLFVWSEDVGLAMQVTDPAGYAVFPDGHSLLDTSSDFDVALIAPETAAVVSSSPSGIVLSTVDMLGGLVGVAGAVLAGPPSGGAQCVPDGTGGGYVVWRSSTPGSVRAQHFDGSGQLLWPSAANIGTTNSGVLKTLQVDTAGFVVGWEASDGLRAQRVSAAGELQWNPGGVLLGVPFAAGSFLALMGDGQSGAAFIWEAAGSQQFYARLDAAGAFLVSPTVLSGLDRPGYYSGMPGGGFAAVWRPRTPLPERVRVQRYGGDGSVVWVGDGVDVAVGFDIYVADIGADAAGNIYPAWRDGQDRLWAQRLTPEGSPSWPGEKVTIGVVPGSGTSGLVSGVDPGGQFVTYAWQGTGEVVVANSLGPSGHSSSYSGIIESVSDRPGDEGGWLTLRFVAPVADPLFGHLAGYGVWRRVSDESATATAPSLSVALPPGQWESVGFFPALQEPQYDFLVATGTDSTSQTTGQEVVVVTCHQDVPSWVTMSAPDSGYSVDNIPPAPPAAFAARLLQSQSVELSWTMNVESDLAYYAVYGASGTQPGGTEARLLGTTLANSWIDPLPLPDRYYEVIAVDRHENRSGGSFLRPSQVVGAGWTDDGIWRLSLGPTRPNPAGVETRLTLAIDRQREVRIDVYNVTGRLVRRIWDAPLTPGLHEIGWDLADREGTLVPSGVYFVRMDADGVTHCRKVAVSR